MSRPSRVAAVGVISIAALPLFPASASADTGTVPVDVGGWFWSTQTSGSDPTGTVPIGRQVPDRASGVKDTSNMPVSYKPGGVDSAREPGADPDKESYVIFDVYGAVPAGATITKMVITLPLADGEDQLNLETAKTSLIACRPDIGVGPAEGEAFASKPIDDCSKAVPATFDQAANAFTFDVTPFAQDWLDADNYGIGIRNKLDQVQPFQVVLKKYSFATAVVEYTPAPAEIPTEQPTFPPVPVDTGNTGGNTGGFTGGPVIQPQPQPQPQPNPQPQPAPTQTKAPTRNVVAAPPFEADLGLPPGMWLGLIVLVGLLGFVSLVLGDPQPGAVTTTSRRLDLRPRRGAHAGGMLPRARTA